MSFKEITGITQLLLTRPEQYPVFILSDVTGDPSGVQSLAEQLHKELDKKSQIYIWNDSVPFHGKRTLDRYAEEIKNEMIKILPEGPYYLAGYSFGGSLANLIAQKLSEEQRPVSLFIIDSPSIEASQGYLFKENNVHASQDLISIFNYAAYLVSHHTNTRYQPLLCREEDINELSRLPITKQLEELTNLVVKSAQSQEIQKTFEDYTGVISQNLLSLLSHPCPAAIYPLDRMGLITTQENNSKYGSPLAKSWQSYAHDIVDNQIHGATHRSLVSGNLKEVAVLMSNYFTTSFSHEQLIGMQLKLWKHVAPTVNVDKVLLEYNKTPLTKNRHRSSSSQPSSSSSSPAIQGRIRTISNIETLNTYSLLSSPLISPASSSPQFPSISASNSPTIEPLRLSDHFEEIDMQLTTPTNSKAEKTPKNIRANKKLDQEHASSSSFLQQPATFFKLPVNIPSRVTRNQEKTQKAEVLGTPSRTQSQFSRSNKGMS